MTNIVLMGAGGRMGRVLADMIALSDDCCVVAGVDSQPMPGAPFEVFSDVHQLSTLGKNPDVLIDFSHPEATLAALNYCQSTALPCVICTTGLDDATHKLMQEASAHTAVFYSANMSLGVNLLAELSRRAAAVLQGYDIEIIEKHHNKKLDAPSGTALMLADTINSQADGAYEYIHSRNTKRQKREPNEIGIHAVRGGGIVGEHDVLFVSENETLTLSHTAHSRDVFAAGALVAAKFLAKQPVGLYSMQSIMQSL